MIVVAQGQTRLLRTIGGKLSLDVHYHRAPLPCFHFPQSATSRISTKKTAFISPCSFGIDSTSIKNMDVGASLNEHLDIVDVRYVRHIALSLM